MKGLITINEKSSKKESVFDMKGVHILKQLLMRCMKKTAARRDQLQSPGSKVVVPVDSLHQLTHRKNLDVTHIRPFCNPHAKVFFVKVIQEFHKVASIYYHVSYVPC